jgi:D-beta-D-heptose 7-phosphate kinase/D-beta-D-heptose 1-phosphate adenosyltransferase
MRAERLKQILGEFPRIRALVIGDFCLDRWCMYDPGLAVPSRETGIPRTAVVSYEVTPGAGGTVTNNLVALGAGRVDIIAVAGDDANGWELERALRCRGVETRHLIRDPARQTFTYTKLLNRATGEEDLPRLDFVNTGPPGRAAELAMLEALETAAPDADVVVVADQSEIAAGAAVTGAVREALISAAARFPEKTFMADSRAQVERFRGLIVKPNEDEAMEAASRVTGRQRLSVEEAGAILRGHLGGKLPLYITRGPEGALLFEGDKPRLVPARRNDNPVDICGAGDAFEAGLALALAATRRLDGAPDYFAAAELGHLVAAVTITKRGTGSASPAELLALANR